MLEAKEGGSSPCNTCHVARGDRGRVREGVRGRVGRWVGVGEGVVYIYFNIERRG